jgi:phenylalanine-4-hydroxylase
MNLFRGKLLSPFSPCNAAQVVRPAAFHRVQAARAGVLMLVISAPYIVRQHYSEYTAEEHALWSEMVRSRRRQLDVHACREYWTGFERIGLEENRLPDLLRISELLFQATGWNATPVNGFLPASAFFEMLAVRRFPTTTRLRSRETLNSR